MIFAGPPEQPPRRLPASQLQSLCDAGALGSATSALCWERGEGAGGDASHVFAGSDTGSIRLWDLERQQGEGCRGCGRMHRTSDLPAHSQRPALPASHHARRPPAARAVAGTFRGHKAAPTCLSHCCATGTLASGSQDTTVKLWDARTRDAARTLKGQGTAITHVAHSPDGQLVVSGSEAGTLQVCGRGRGCATQCAHSQLGWCLCLARSRAERAHRHLHPQLLTAPPTPAQVWDMPTGRLLRELRGHTKRVHSLAFHPEETLLASASADRTVRFWDLGAGASAPVEVDKAGPAAREARAVAFPSDGRALLAAAADGLRAYGWEPAREHDAVAVPWAKVCGGGVRECVCGSMNGGSGWTLLPAVQLQDRAVLGAAPAVECLWLQRSRGLCMLLPGCRCPSCATLTARRLGWALRTTSSTCGL